MIHSQSTTESSSPSQSSHHLLGVLNVETQDRCCNIISGEPQEKPHNTNMYQTWWVIHYNVEITV